ncbi:MAG: P-loop containing nucleoside triphosphate hydrolase protein [Monoraphidium minutum]|nr:MAG: P-loop containing nucleoside triphosphate hydrolase protein [Monoraphidium minutum]
MAPKKEEPPAKAARFGRVRNNLKMGILGLPNVGKSSLFNLLTDQAIAAENYPFCTIDPNDSRCAVPDARYDWLCDLWKPPSMYPAYLHVTDIAGLVRGAAEGAGLGNAFLSHVAAVDGLFHVVRAFDSDEVVHVDDSVDPVRDLDTIQLELCKKDLEYVGRMEAEAVKDAKKTPNMKLPLHFYSTFEKVKELLGANKPVRDAEWTAKEVELILEKMPQLLTAKPVVYLVNMSASDFARKKNKHLPKIHQWIQEHGGGTMIPFSVEWEQKLWSLREDADGSKAFLDETKCQSVLPKMIVTGFKELNLIFYFTAGETEVRCWTIQQGTLAPQAAGVIHTDFERGFIKAEVVAYDDFKSLATSKSMSEVKAAGKYRQEGKQYVVADGDIIHFQFNVTTKKK